MTVKLTAAAVVAATALAVAPSAAQACTPKLSAGEESYDVRLCGITDFDQYRIARSGVGAANFSFTGMPFDGEYSCGPTSLTNLLAFYTRRGLATAPADYPWETRIFAEQSEPQNFADYNTVGYSANERAAYEQVTKLITLINPQINSNGSNYGTLPGQLDAVLSHFTTSTTFTYAADSFGADAPRQIATAIANGATVLVGGEAFGSGSVGSDGVRDLGGRVAGHALTVRGIKGKGSRAVIFLRDPAVDESTKPFAEYNGDRVRQSRFMTQVGSLRRMSVRFPQTSLEGGPDGTTAPATQSTWAYGGEFTSTSGEKRMRFLTTWLAIYPQTLVYKSSSGFSAIGKLANLGSASDGDPARTVVRTFDVGPIVDATFVPQSSEVVYVRSGGRDIEAMNVVTRTRRVLGRAPAGTVDLEADPRRADVLVLGADSLVRQPVTDGLRLTRTAPGFDTLAFDPRGDRVALVAADSGAVRVLTGGQLSARGPATLPAGALDGDGRVLAAFDDAGRLLLRRTGSTTVQRVAFGDGVTLLTPTQVRGSGLVVDDGGAVLTTSSSGRIRMNDGSNDIAYRSYQAPGQLVALDRSAAAIPDLAYLDRVRDAFRDAFRGRPSKGFVGLESLPDDVADDAQDALSF